MVNLKNIFGVSLGLAALALAGTAFAADYGSVQQNIQVGRVLSVGLNPGPSWVVYSNNNQSVASAKIVGSTLMVNGLSAGSALIEVCSDQQGNSCFHVTVNVSSGASQILGAYTSAMHPVGSWVVAKGTVYYVSSSGLIPVPSWKIFLNNGGQSKLIETMTPQDAALTMLPNMQLNDSRVK